MKENEEMPDEFENRLDDNHSPWIDKDLFDEEKPKPNFNFKRKKRKYRLNQVPRSEIYEPIRRNEYYMLLKEYGIDKDEILCGVNKKTIKINKVLYNCFTVADLKSNERQMFQWVLGKTTGYKRREVELNIYGIAKEIGRSRSFVYNSLQRLVEKEMIFITENNGKPSIYLNTMPDTWNSVGDKVKELLNEEYNRLSINM